MKFSIIIPVFRIELYLNECVNSVLNQSYQDFELILVDDGSPDSCPEICDKYSSEDSRITVIHKENGGLSDARNAGIDIAKGEYIIFIDGDDFLISNTVLEQLSKIIDNNSVDVIQYGHEIYLHKENRIIEGAPRNCSVYNGEPFSNVLHNLVALDELAVSAWSMAIKKDFLINNNLYFVKDLKSEDIEWAIRLFLFNPKIYLVDEFFYAYRKGHGNTITSNVNYKHLCDYCWIIEKSVERVEKADDSIKMSLMSYLMYHVLIASAFCYKVKLQKEQKNELLNRLKVLCNKRICRYKLNKKVKLASFLYCIFGFKTMTIFLGIYLKNRGR